MKYNYYTITDTNPISFDISSCPSLAVYSNKYKQQVQWLYRTLTKNNVAGIKYCFSDEVIKINRCLAYSFDEPFVDTYMPLYSSNGINKLIEIIREKCVLNFSGSIPLSSMAPLYLTIHLLFTFQIT